ncbi:MAG: outer membrane lipoprotein chaperone LolA [Gammaproteobacteria bacterium]|nr:outer membrane lipoprotein chaperone LolA [Gammaproteobacteria bacterium]
MKQIIFFVLMLFCAHTPAYAAKSAPLDGFLNALKTFHARFEQKLLDDNGELLESSHGEMYLQRPGKFRWEYQRPYQQLIVTDGRQVWMYDRDLEQVTIKNMDNTLGTTPALLLSSERSVEDAFVVNNLPQQAGVERVELKPKSKDAQFQRMRLNFADTLLEKLELLDNLGQTTLIRFSQQQRNPELNTDLFKFSPPPDVDIIDGTE